MSFDLAKAEKDLGEVDETPPQPPPALLPDTPAAWFAAKFPALPASHGDAVQEAFPPENKGRPFVKDVSEDFLSATLGEAGTPAAPTVFVADEDRFHRPDQLSNYASVCELPGRTLPDVAGLHIAAE